MYRRNITHILIPLGLIPILIVGYHLFLKPRMATAPDPATSIAPEALEAVAPPPPPPAGRPGAEEAAQVRMLELPAIPNNQYDALLGPIRDDIEKHDLPAAETKLTKLPATLLADEKAKPIVAILWNNLGLEQEQLQGTQLSLKAFKKAVTFDDSNPTILMNLAHAYWEQRDPSLNQDLLAKLIRLAPDEPFPHLAMADLLQEQDQLADAAKHLSHATSRAKQDPALRSYLASVTAKVLHTESVEAKMTARSSTHFMVKFDGEEDHQTWTAVLEILEEAYREIGQKLGHFPSKPITVVLHTKASFQGATGSPAWADGLYDPTLGRIQLPTQGATTDKKWLTNVVRHEYVHALLHDRLGSSLGTLPTWLNEGLAMQLAGDPGSDLDQVLQGDIKVIPLNYLEGSWTALPASAATLAYLEANSATHYLIERWGFPRVEELLNEFKSKVPVATALQNKLFVSYEQFFHQWLESFEQKRT
jgi:tetratricopeptide (TPR) repeat protein